MKEPKPRRAAPVCYGHPGGILGERLSAALVGKGWLAIDGRDFRITPAGRRGLSRLGVDLKGID